MVASVAIPRSGPDRDAHDDRLSVCLHGHSEPQPLEPYLFSAQNFCWPNELPGDPLVSGFLE